MSEKLLVEHLQILIFGFVFALVSLSFASYFKFFQKQEGGVSSPPIFFSNVLIAFAIFIASQIFFVPLLWLFWVVIAEKRLPSESDFHLDVTTQSWLNVFTILVAAVGLFEYTYFFKRDFLRQIWNGKAHGFKYRLRDFFIGMFSWFLAYPTMLFVGQIVSILVLLKFQPSPIEQVAVKQLRMLKDNPTLFWIMGAMIVSVVPFIEELLFRGYLQTWIKKHLGAFKAILITSAVFALFHFSPSQEAANVELVVSLFVLSCFLGYVYERQRSLAASIALHATFNGISLLFIILSGE